MKIIRCKWYGKNRIDSRLFAAHLIWVYNFIYDENTRMASSLKSWLVFVNPKFARGEFHRNYFLFSTREKYKLGKPR